METIREGRWPQQCLPCYRSGRRKTVSCKRSKNACIRQGAGNSGCSEGRHAFSLCGGIPPERRAPLGRDRFLCGRCAGRMLLPDGIIPPDGGSVKAFLPDALAPLILFNTACDVLSRRRQPPGEECITLLDPKGGSRAGSRLLAFASLVRCHRSCRHI